MKWFRRLKRPVKALVAVVCAAVFLVALNFVLQHGVAHLTQPYVPTGAFLDLRPILETAALSDADYLTLLQQTGLGKPAVDDYLTRGELGIELILATQEGFFHPPASRCNYLIPSTMEERLYDADGKLTTGVPLAPLRDGDVLLAFSTHTAGWRHGHAGIVIDAARQLTLESVSKGDFAAVMNVRHWNTYSMFMVLRPRDLTDEQRREAIDFALEHLDGAPYNLLCGIFGEKAPEPTEGMAVHCAYLPWYVYMQIGVDLDANGGAIVTVRDLSESPYLEVVQVFGINPAEGS